MPTTATATVAPPPSHPHEILKTPLLKRYPWLGLSGPRARSRTGGGFRDRRGGGDGPAYAWTCRVDSAGLERLRD